MYFPLRGHRCTTAFPLSSSLEGIVDVDHHGPGAADPRVAQRLDAILRDGYRMLGVS
jgi:hypothetical protein